MKNNKKISLGSGIVVGMLFLLTFVSAFSVSVPYMENKQLNLEPGAVMDFEVVLQNSGGTENSDVRARVLEGYEIMTLVDESDIYTIVPGEHTKVNFRITIPEEGVVGGTYPMKIGISSVTQSQSGVFGFGSEIEQSFEVVIVAEAKKGIFSELNLSGNWLVYLGVIAGIIVAILVFFFVRNRRNN